MFFISRKYQKDLITQFASFVKGLDVFQFANQSWVIYTLINVSEV